MSISSLKKKIFYSTELTIAIVSFKVASTVRQLAVNISLLLHCIRHLPATHTDYLLPSLCHSYLSLKNCTMTVQLAITEMHRELLLLKFHVKRGTESKGRSKWSNSSMPQSRHCKHKATKYRDIKDFRLSKRRNLPNPNSSL